MVRPPQKVKKHRINGEVRFDKVRLISEDTNVVMSSFEASILAKDLGLDLILINENATPPVVKIEEYSKFLFNLEKLEKQNKKNQKLTELKEIQLSTNIADNDIETKAKKTIEFLEKGNKVKVSLLMKGRQKYNPSRGELTMVKFIDSLSEFCDPEYLPKFENSRWISVLKPKKKQK